MRSMAQTCPERLLSTVGMTRRTVAFVAWLADLRASRDCFVAGAPARNHCKD